MKVIAFIRKKVDNKKNQRQSKCSRYIMKRVLSIILALSLVVPVVDFTCVKEVAAYSSYGDFQYTVLDDGTIQITGYDASGSQNEVVIPNMIEGKRVTSIGSSAFLYCSSLTSIEIPESVTSIGSNAFSCCSSLASIVIPSSVTSIGSLAFGGCRSLASIVIPSSVTSLEECAFSGCSSLESIEIPSSVTSIGSSAFLGCISLKSIEIPSSVTSIGSYSFSGCSGLASIEIPSR